MFASSYTYILSLINKKLIPQLISEKASKLLSDVSVATFFI